MRLKVLKVIKFDRLRSSYTPSKSCSTAIALGGIVGVVGEKPSFTGGGWLPAPYTDSVFTSVWGGV